MRKSARTAFLLVSSKSEGTIATARQLAALPITHAHDAFCHHLCHPCLLAYKASHVAKGGTALCSERLDALEHHTGHRHRSLVKSHR
jgi:hypothetical protein